MKGFLIKLKNILSRFLGIGRFFKKHPFVIFLILVFLSFGLAFCLFYQEAYRAINFSPDPQIEKPQINQEALLEVQKIIGDRQKNIDQFQQKIYRNPFE